MVLARWLRLLPMICPKLLLGVAETLDKLAVAAGFFDGVQVRALNVFDDRKLKRFLVR